MVNLKGFHLSHMIIYLFFIQGADPSIIDDKGQTLIHLAVASINIKILTLLLDFPTLYRMVAAHLELQNDYIFISDRSL